MAPQWSVRTKDVQSSFAIALADVLESATVPAATAALTDSDSPFDATRLPSVSIGDYMTRLERYCCCTDECFIVSLVYLERVLEYNPGYAITNLNVHRLLLAASILSAKFQDDDYYSNAYYSKVGGVSTEEMLLLEASLLELLHWRAHVSVEEYEDCLERLHKGRLRLSSEEAKSKLHVGAIAADPVVLETPAVIEAKPKPHMGAIAADPVVLEKPAVTEEVHAKPAPYIDLSMVAPVIFKAHTAMEEVVGTEVTPMQRPTDMEVDCIRKTAAIVIGEKGSLWTSGPGQRRPRRRSATPVAHVNARRTRLCLVAH